MSYENMKHHTTIAVLGFFLRSVRWFNLAFREVPYSSRPEGEVNIVFEGS